MSADIKHILNLLENLELEQIFEEELVKSQEYQQYIAEASTLLDFARKDFPGDKQLIELLKFLHREQGVSSRAKLEPYINPSGNLDLKIFKSHYDNFRLFKGKRGWAATRPEPTALRRKIEADPNYVPSDDPTLLYQGFFSVTPDEDQPSTSKDKNPIVQTTFLATRGGRYTRGEKPGVTAPVMADILSKEINPPERFRFTVWQLMDRDPESLKNLPPEMFSGKGSRRRLSPGGASIERAKKDARAKKTEIEEIRLSKETAKRLLLFSNKIFRFVKLKVKDNEKLDQMVLATSPLSLSKKPLGKFAERVKEKLNTNVWIDMVSDIIISDPDFQNVPDVKTELANYRSNNPQDKSSDTLLISKLAYQRNPTITLALIKFIRNKLINNPRLIDKLAS